MRILLVIGALVSFLGAHYCFTRPYDPVLVDCGLVLLMGVAVLVTLATVISESGATASPDRLRRFRARTQRFFHDDYL